MTFKSIKILFITIISSVSFNANAVVINNLYGINYEWLELTATINQSRSQVEAQLIDSTSILFGYNYATRQQVQDLFLSYVPWGLNNPSGYYGAPELLSGGIELQTLFGITKTFVDGDGINDRFITTDGYAIGWETINFSYGLYGNTGECEWAGITNTCLANVEVGYAVSGQSSYLHIAHYQGWDANDNSPATFPVLQAYPSVGSFLVRELTPIPIPAAVWLLGSGLIGLIGMGRRRARAKIHC